MTGFDEFWAIAALKRAKIAAGKAYDKALKRTTHETIMTAWRAYSDEYKKPAKGWRPEPKHPATWLNGGCWDDEPAPKHANGNGHRRSIADAAAELIASTTGADGGQRTIDLGPEDYAESGGEGRRAIGRQVR